MTRFTDSHPSLGGVALVLDGERRDLGGFAVSRVLPRARARSVGPFVFFDHMGPDEFPAGVGIDVRPHPHIGIATVTYLFAGAIRHRDSLGSDQVIAPGDVNWMRAGRGIVHSERTPPDARRAGHTLHGLQLWVALPREKEEAEPTFRHHERASLPERAVGSAARVRVLAGTAFGVTSPVEVDSPLFYVDAELGEGAALTPPEGYDERAVYVVEGAVSLGEQRVAPGQMALLRAGDGPPVVAEGAARVMLLGGAPLDAPRHVFWNFVSSSRDRIEDAKRDWREGRFPEVPGDAHERIELPE